MADIRQSDIDYHINDHDQHNRVHRCSQRPSSGDGGGPSSADVNIPAIAAMSRYAYCCFCIHVKPATIVIAIWKLIRSLQFAVLLLNAELSAQERHSGGHSFSRYQPSDQHDDLHRSTNVAFCILLRVIIGSASGVAIYAVCSGRAGLLMPLYSMVLIDFFLGLPAFYNRDIDPTYADGLSDFPSDPMPPQHNDRLLHNFFLTSALILISKIYFLCVIWQCFRYLRLRELVGASYTSSMHVARMYAQMPSGGHPSLDGGAFGDDDRMPNVRSSLAPPAYDSIAPSIKPPTYEDAIKASSIFTIDMSQAAAAGAAPPPPQPLSHQTPTTAAAELSSDQADRLPAYSAHVQPSSSVDHMA